MVVVAGSCFIDRTVQKSGVHVQLGAPTPPKLRESIATVLHANRAIGLIAKLNGIPEEAAMSLRPGEGWAPVVLPDGFGGPLGVLICLDFLERQHASFTTFVAPKLDTCRLLAVPALSPKGSLALFQGHLVEEAGPRRRPVLFANYSLGGGSTIAVSERSFDELCAFPLHAGVLEAGEEGMLVADVDLAVVGVGRTGRYGEDLRCTPFAAASFVYSGISTDLAAWHTRLSDVLSEDLGSDNEEEVVLDRALAWLEANAPPRANETPMQKRRWDRLAQGLARESSVESLRRLTREVVLPPDVLPIQDLQSALSRGAAHVMNAWIQGAMNDSAQFVTVAQLLQEKASKADSRQAVWADPARQAWLGIVENVRGTHEHSHATVLSPFDRATATVENEIVKAALDEGNAHALEGRHQQALDAYERARSEAELQGTENTTYGSKWRLWAARAAIGAASCAINLQDPGRAQRLVEGIPVAALDTRRRLRLANLWAALGDIDRARATLPAPPTSPLTDEILSDRQDVLQRIAIMEGHIPPDDQLSSTSDIALMASFALLKQHNAARAAEIACGILVRADEMDLIRAEAARALLSALIFTITEPFTDVLRIPIEARARIIRSVEEYLPGLVTDESLPASFRPSVIQQWRIFTFLSGDYDALAASPESVPLGSASADDETSLHADVLLARQLAEQGHVEAALAALSPDEHPWRTRLTRVDLLRQASQNDRALSEALALTREVVDCAPIERAASELLSMHGRHEEALTHAERALIALPARGIRRRVAECLLALHRGKEAWEALASDECGAGPYLLRVLAIAADLVYPGKAVHLWQKYVTLRPDDGEARVHVAQLLFGENRLNEAAEIAWTAFEESGGSLSIDYLHSVGKLQSGAPTDGERRRRIMEVVAAIKQRFPRDAHAEQARLSLLMSQRDLTTADAPIDFVLLHRTGRAQSLTTSEVIELLRTQRDFSQLVARFGRQGSLPIALFCAALRPTLSVPELVTRIFRRERVPTPFSAPVGLHDVPPGIRLDGGHLLLSEVEIYLLGALELLGTLQKSLQGGQVFLFRSAWTRIVDDHAKLLALAKYSSSESLGEKVAALALLPRLVHEPSEEPVSDVQLILRRGGTILDTANDKDLRATGVEEEIPEDRRLSPRTVLRRLREEGRISFPIANDIERYFIQDMESPERIPTPTPLLVNAFLLEKLWEHRVLEEFLKAFPGSHLGNSDFRNLLERQRGAIEQQQAAQLADHAHAWVAEGMRAGWLVIIVDPEVTGLPHLLAQDQEPAQSMLREPLEWAVKYADTLTQHPTWWRPVADFFGSTSPVSKEMVQHLIPQENRERDGRALLQRLQGGRERHVSLPALVRLLLPGPTDQGRNKTLWKLAELGFPDALGAEEIIALFGEYGGLDGIAARWVLGQLEWMSREPNHLGGDTARVRIANVYAAALTMAFCHLPNSGSSQAGLPASASQDTVSLTKTQSEALATALLLRAETLANDTESDVLEMIFYLVGIRTMSELQLTWLPPHEEKNTWSLRSDSRIPGLWSFLHAWARTDGSRHAACERGVRDAWLALAFEESNGHRIELMSAALLHAVEVDNRDGDFRFTELAAETQLILSAVMQGIAFRTFHLSDINAMTATSVSEEELLAHGAHPATSFTVDRDGRFVAYPWSMPGGSTLTVFAPVEALLLRQGIPEMQRFARFLKRVQGPNDGRAYRILTVLEQRPERTSVRRLVVRYAASALWRAVRDDPSYLVRWPRSRNLGLDWAHPSLKELRLILSEPCVLEPSNNNLMEILFQRRITGLWQDRDDAWDLLKMAFEVPGLLSHGPVRSMLVQKYEVHVKEALSILEDAENYPIARVSRSILLLRVGAAHKPMVRLQSGEDIDLREILPELFRQVLEKVTESAKEDTFGASEPLLIRVCGKVVRDLAANQAISIRDGLWLTYRLFQWLCVQLDALSLEERISGIRRLVALAPSPEDVQDRLNPYGFGRDLFDHRLATVLHALGMMDEMAHSLSAGTEISSEPPLPMAWPPAMIDNLVELAVRPDESLGLRSELAWDAPDNVADLAIVALLRADPNAFDRLPSDVRLGRLRRLPVDPDTMDRADQLLFSTIVASAATNPEILSDEERAVLISSMHTPSQGQLAKLWRLLVLPSFFGRGDPRVSKFQAIDALRSMLDSRVAPMALTYILLGFARCNGEQLGEVFNRIIAEVEMRQIDPIPFVIGVGRVFLSVEEPARETMVGLIQGLSSRQPFTGNQHLQDLLVLFSKI
jgi:tetratricopeptide (TPR) repeat protein